MTTTTVEMRLTLAQDMAHKLREAAQTRGVTEGAVVQQTLDLRMFVSSFPVYYPTRLALRRKSDALEE